MTNFDSVKKFMEKFGQEVKTKPEFPSEKIVKLRYGLIKEELDEFEQALKDKNLEEKINNYINEKHGAFDVVDAANELGLPIEIIESTAMTLKNKGKIKTSR